MKKKWQNKKKIDNRWANRYNDRHVNIKRRIHGLPSIVISPWNHTILRYRHNNFLFSAVITTSLAHNNSYNFLFSLVIPSITTTTRKWLRTDQSFQSLQHSTYNWRFLKWLKVFLHLIHSKVSVSCLANW